MKNKKLMIVVVVLLMVVGVGGYFGYNHFFGTRKVIVDSTEQGLKIAEYANPDAFITPLQLLDLMENDKGVVVIGALNPTKADSPISGSFTMWRPAYSASEGVYNYGGMANTVEEMETILSNFGVKQDTTIVVYASNDHHDAARLWWQIKLLGHKDVRYLDGGLNAWIGAGYATGNANPTVEATNYKAPNPKTAALATFDDVVAALADSNTIILDTRAANEEKGETTLAGAAGPGKIPGATWINWTQSVREDTTLKSRAELDAIYGSLKGKNVITYCQSGVRSAHTLLILTQVLGIENVKNYDGSWIEWSYMHYTQNNPKAVVENGNR
jgi:thiosulfate/3-mercaptopyruvate sulfurtransferase